jgi:hypothetical protein
MKHKVMSTSFDVNQEGIIKPKELFSTDVSFHNVSLDFFGSSSKRDFTILFDFDTPEGSTLTSNFGINLPVIEQSEFEFYAPKTIFPDPITRCICKQDFKMKETNSEPERERYTFLEVFKLIPTAKRFKTHGYVAMMEQFLHIENSYEIDTVQRFNLENVELMEVSSTHHRIDVSFSPSLQSSPPKIYFHF